LPANARDATINHSAKVWFSTPQLIPNRTYDAAAPSVLISNTGRRPIRSESRPQIGAKDKLHRRNECDDDADVDPCAPNAGLNSGTSRYDDAEPDEVMKRSPDDEQQVFSSFSNRGPSCGPFLQQTFAEFSGGLRESRDGRVLFADRSVPAWDKRRESDKMKFLILETIMFGFQLAVSA